MPFGSEIVVWTKMIIFSQQYSISGKTRALRRRSRPKEIRQRTLSIKTRHHLIDSHPSLSSADLMAVESSARTKSTPRIGQKNSHHTSGRSTRSFGILSVWPARRCARTRGSGGGESLNGMRVIAYCHAIVDNLVSFCEFQLINPLDKEHRRKRRRQIEIKNWHSQITHAILCFLILPDLSRWIPHAYPHVSRLNSVGYKRINSKRVNTIVKCIVISKFKNLWSTQTGRVTRKTFSLARDN